MITLIMVNCDFNYLKKEEKNYGPLGYALLDLCVKVYPKHIRIFICIIWQQVLANKDMPGCVEGNDNKEFLTI